MKNIDLECILDWRYCQIPRGQKGPRYANWQNKPYTIDQIDDTGNVGLLLGPVSGGVCALDFDGESAWTWFEQTFGRTAPTDSIMWSSGKQSRCQMAFSVPSEYWDHLKTIKITLDYDESTGKHEGFEFRWTGGQSVLPPSLHPDTGCEYFWVAEPRRTELQLLAEDVLCYWLDRSNPVVEELTPKENVDFSQVTERKFEELNNILVELKKLYPNLAYDDWLHISFATANEIGNEAAALLLNTLWPEQKTGEYRRLLKTRNPSRSPTIRSLVYRLKLTNRENLKREILELEKELIRRKQNNER